MMLQILVFIALSFIATVTAAPFDDFSHISPQNLTRHLVTSEGYPIQEYFVNTPDGFILKVFRIPGSAQSPPANGKTVVFLQHGLLCSSDDWLVLGKGKALAYLLADAGYDVWLGNARGNTYSRRHQHLSPNRQEFCEFSWHQIGQFDLPAMIDLALSTTGQKDLHYIGHSQGTTAFFVMGALRTDFNAKIKTMHALDTIEDWMEMFGVYEFLPSNQLMKDGGQLVCHDKSPFQEVCANVLFLIAGYDSAQLDRSLLPVILENTPAGSSVKQLVHYAQGVNSGKFRIFDFGYLSNIIEYGSLSPPNYNLKGVIAPVYLYYSDNDWLAAVRDVDELVSKLPNLAGKLKVSDPKFNHLDFTYGTYANTLVYDRILNIIKTF